LDTDINELLLTAIRTTLVYGFVLCIVRLMGKRSVGAISAFDLIVALMIGEVVDEIAYGDVSLVQGFLVIGIVAGWHILNAWASYKSKTIERLTEGQPAVLVKNGQIQRAALGRERMSDEDLRAQLRLLSVEDLQEVKQATLEPSGHISVLLEEWARPAQKSDLEHPHLKAK
jgi:uncharacterized membrane protein YcaP (DUF421 family)